MAAELHLGELTLPLDVQTNTTVVYGGKGMGKTTLGAVLVEELSKRRLKFNVIDPLDVWWGIQHGATRSSPGLDVVILGGIHGDIPIEPTAGAVVADFVVDEEVSTITVLRHASGKMWTKGEKIRFVTEYCTRLYERQGEERRPVLQLIDEAGRYCPQNPSKGDLDIARCIGAIEELVECGRNVGVGVCLITQRSARMNKSVSELAECMIAFRTVGPNSVQAIVDWFGEHVERERHKQLVEQLRKLERGTALVVSPGWLQFEGVVKIRQRETFDSSATPQPGKSLRAPGPARKPDLEQYRVRMAETIEKASQENPKELRKQLASLQRELAQAHAKKATEQRQLTPVPDPKFVAQLEEANRHLRTMDQMHALSEHAQKIVSELRDLRIGSRAMSSFIDNFRKTLPPNAPMPALEGDYESLRESRKRPAPPAPLPVRGMTGDDEESDGSALPKGLRRILIALAQVESSKGLTRKKLAIRSGRSPNSGTYAKYLARARFHEWIRYEGGLIYITAAGLLTLGSDWEPLPTGPALLQYWLNTVGAPSKILEAAAKFYPREPSREELAKAVKQSNNSGTFAKYLARLRALDLMIGNRVVDELMEAA